MSETVTEKALRPWYTKPRNIVVMLAAVVLLILVLQNMGAATITILFWKAEIPAALVYIAFAAAGFAAARITHKRKKRV